MPYKDKEKQLQYFKDRYVRLKDKLSDKARLYYLKNKEKIKERNKNNYWDNREEKILKVRKYYSKNKKKIAKKVFLYYHRITKKRLENDPAFRIKFRLRKRMWYAIKLCKTSKCEKTLELLGCKDINEVKKYLEKKFKKGMSWDNYGKWHIDHIKPLSSFNLSDPKEQKIAFHYKNLQPLWAKENLQKGGKVCQ